MTLEQIAVSLLVWISGHSSYREVATLPPPPIVTMSAAELTAMVRQRAGLPVEDPRNRPFSVNGFYTLDESEHGVIYLVRAEDTPGAEDYPDPTDNPIFRERLLHELVHHVQQATGTMYGLRCPQQRELAAYHLGGVYLKERAVRDPIPDRVLYAVWAASC